MEREIQKSLYKVTGRAFRRHYLSDYFKHRGLTFNISLKQSNCLIVNMHAVSILRVHASTWTGSCCLKTGARSGKTRRTYSSLVHSSAISSTLGSTNGTMSRLTNSEVNAGKILYTTTLWEKNSVIQKHKPSIWQGNYCEINLNLQSP